MWADTEGERREAEIVAGKASSDKREGSNANAHASDTYDRGKGQRLNARGEDSGQGGALLRGGARREIRRVEGAKGGTYEK